MLKQDKPDDYVIATGQTRSVRQFLEKAFSIVDLDWQEFVEFDPAYLRPSEVDCLIGDATKAKKQLGWTPKTNFDELVHLMVEADIKAQGLQTTNKTKLHQHILIKSVA